MSQGEPGADEVLAWLERQQRPSAAAAVRHFWPEATAADHKRLCARVRTWCHRAGTSGAPAAPRKAPTRPAAPSSEPEAESLAELPDLASMTLEQRLSWQMRRLVRLAEDAQRRKDARAVASLDARISSVGAELEAARRAEGPPVRLDRTPAAVALAMKKRARAIEILAGAGERMAAEQAGLCTPSLANISTEAH